MKTGIHRRTFLAATGALLVAPLTATAQRGSRPGRLGYIGVGRGPLADAFLEGTRAFGYVEGQNLSIERREYQGSIVPRLPEIAAEFVRLKVDAVFAAGPAAIKAFAGAIQKTPVVGIDLESDPVEAGFAKSLARPGGNITGVFLDLPGLTGKWFDFLKAMMPGLSRAAVLWDPATGRSQYNAVSAAARSTAVRLDITEVRNPADLEAAFARIATARAQAVIQLSSPLFFVEVARVARFCADNRLPAISLFRAFADSGGLLSYGPDIPDLYRRCGVYVGRILSGARASELPIERPTRFFLTINRKTATAFGLPIAPSLLLQADQMIE
jgi:putative tryptophan/tyrosine transport system substrate-binding protein